MNSHRKLLAWQACRDLTRAIYRITRGFPADERFGLTLQLRRAAVSAGANIAEGHARTGLRETGRGFSIAVGSLAEVDSLLAVAEDESYVSEQELDRVGALLVRASQLSHGYLRKLRTRLKP